MAVFHATGQPLLSVALVLAAGQLAFAGCAPRATTHADEPMTPLDSALLASDEKHRALELSREWIAAAVRTYYAELLAGRPLQSGARTIWFLGDATGAVIATGTRAALPDTVGFDALPTLVPEIGTRAYEGFTLTGAGPEGPAADVTVLWIALVPTR